MADDTISDLKHRIRDSLAECAVKLQRLLIQVADDKFVVLEDDAVTLLGALGIQSERVVGASGGARRVWIENRRC